MAKAKPAKASKRPAPKERSAVGHQKITGFFSNIKCIKIHPSLSHSSLMNSRTSFKLFVKFASV